MLNSNIGRIWGKRIVLLDFLILIDKQILEIKLEKLETLLLYAKGARY
jgi:hypothetical protein